MRTSTRVWALSGGCCGFLPSFLLTASAISHDRAILSHRHGARVPGGESAFVSVTMPSWFSVGSVVDAPPRHLFRCAHTRADVATPDCPCPLGLLGDMSGAKDPGPRGEPASKPGSAQGRAAIKQEVAGGAAHRDVSGAGADAGLRAPGRGRSRGGLRCGCRRGMQGGAGAGCGAGRCRRGCGAPGCEAVRARNAGRGGAGVKAVECLVSVFVPARGRPAPVDGAGLHGW